MLDELNRTPPRSQSALLQAMAEYQVSVDGTTHKFSRPFHVIAKTFLLLLLLAIAALIEVNVTG